MSKLCLLILSWIAFFGGTPPQTICVHAYAASDNKCALPGPNSVDIETVGPTYFYIGWDAVPDAAFYRVDVYKYPNGPLITSKIATALPGRNTVLTDGLALGASYNIFVYSGCSNGMFSTKL